jgi:ATP-dependent Clp protease ATP-binding subunit ClpA
MLYEMVEDARSLPLGADKCILDRDKVLDLMDEIKAQLPVELSEAKKLIAAKAEYVAGAKREAELLRQQAEDQAKKLISEDHTIAIARQKSQEMVQNAEERARDLKRVASEYCEDVLKRTEEAITQACEEVRASRIKFRSASITSAQEGKE